MQSEEGEVELVFIPIEYSLQKGGSFSEHGVVDGVGQGDVVNLCEHVDNFDASDKVVGHFMFGFLFHLHKKIHILRKHAFLSCFLNAIRLLIDKLIPILQLARINGII